MQVEQISQQLEARLLLLARDIKSLKQVKYKAEGDEKTSITKKHQPYEEYEFQLRALEAKLETMNEAIAKIRDINSCGFDKLVTIVSLNKEISNNLLLLEAKVAHSLIKVESDKINTKLDVVEPKLFILNEAKLRLHQDTLENFERTRKIYISIKSRFDYLLKQEQAQVIPPNENMWLYRNKLEQQQALVRDLTNLYTEAKILVQEVGEIQMPVFKKFSCEVDQMLFDFKEIKQTDILIQKLSPNNYIFGTRKIYAKVTNGVLLIRVGGGFMDIENFFSLYGDQELVKQRREEEKEAKRA